MTRCQRLHCEGEAVIDVQCVYADGSMFVESECAEHLVDLFDYLQTLTGANDWPRELSVRAIVQPYSARPKIPS